MGGVTLRTGMSTLLVLGGFIGRKLPPTSKAPFPRNVGGELATDFRGLWRDVADRNVRAPRTRRVHRS